MANLPGSIKNLNTLLGEQLLEGGGSEGGGGSSDFSTATVTMVGAVHGILPYCRDMLDVEEQTWWEGGTHTIALYKGKAYVYLTNVDSVSGDIQQNDENIFIITGNCTINAKE